MAGSWAGVALDRDRDTVKGMPFCRAASLIRRNSLPYQPAPRGWKPQSSRASAVAEVAEYGRNYLLETAAGGGKSGWRAGSLASHGALGDLWEVRSLELADHSLADLRLLVGGQGAICCHGDSCGHSGRGRVRTGGWCHLGALHI